MEGPGKPPPASEITPERLYLRRREFIRNAGLFAATSAGVGGSLLWLMGGTRAGRRARGKADHPASREDRLAATKSRLGTDEPRTPERDVTTYNNFYEFGTDKGDPAEYAHTLRPRPWTVRAEGEIARPQSIDVDQLLRWFPLEERVYRMRCVEAWSMVIPWVGYPLAELVKRVEPTSRAKFVRFETLLDRTQLPGVKRDVLPWPYVEALRIDEATHPLALLAFGLYGHALPGQNGAPVRLVVPWKYGFKGAKSIVKISFTAEQPKTTWNEVGSNEYGFYANVNPDVDHPRWSQATERRIGEFRRRKTLPFNGYADEVAHLYAGMDLRVNF